MSVLLIQRTTLSLTDKSGLWNNDIINHCTIKYVIISN